MILIATGVMLLASVAPAEAIGPVESPPALEVRTTTATVGPHGWFAITIYCLAPGTSSCRGQLTVWNTKVQPRGPVPTADPLPLAHHRYSFPSSTETTVHMRFGGKLISRLKEEGPTPMFVKAPTPNGEAANDEVFFQLRN
jgi:hypothetical protein